MGSISRLFRFPRPQSFLYLMTLRTGTELIAFSLLFNKISGFYGLLAVLTGYHLSPIQLSMYIYSVFALILTIYLFPHIRKQSPFQNLLFAFFYLIDSIINAAYTAAFALSWFLAISSHHKDSSATKGPGADTIADTSGFTSPEHGNVSAVAIDGLKPGQDTVAATYAKDTTAGTNAEGGSPTFSHGMLQPESLQSITSILLLWTLRAYFTVIVFSYARYVLRTYIANISRQNTALHTGSSDATMLENPFEAAHRPEGQGWKGRLGRFMVAIGRSYWLSVQVGNQDEIRWMDAVGGKFRRSAETSSLEAGTMNNTNIERERRRRSGTGPPAPPPNLANPQPGMLAPDAAKRDASS